MFDRIVRCRRVYAAAFVIVAAFISGCETSSTVSTSPNPVKCQVSLGAAPTLEATGGGGSVAITTQPECAWDASSNVNWISGLTPTSGQGNGNLSFRVAANDGSSTRDGMIVVNGEQARVSQRAPCRYDVGPSSQSMGADGGASSLTVTTVNECAWTAVSEVNWISLASSTTGSGNGTVAFTVAPNQGVQRSGSIAIGNQRSLVTQAGITAPACDSTIAPTSQSIAATGGVGATVSVSVANTCQWTTTSGVSWITVMSGSTGTGNGSVTFTVAANGGAARTGTLTIAGRGFTVSQGAAGSPPPPPPPPASCSYSISPRSRNASALGDTDTVGVSTTSACAWTAASNDAWIAITAGATGTGNGSVGYLVLPNIGSSRTGTLSVAGQIFTVTQAAVAPCAYSISPGSQKVNKEAGTGSVTVSTGSTCTWTAASNDSWITVTSGASGTGNGTVTFSYTANATDKDRKGTLTVAGRTATIEQHH